MKKALTKEIENIDKKESQNQLSIEDNERRTSIESYLSNIDFKEAQLWVQCAKKIWIKEGDENTTFFHKACTVKQKKSFISKIEDEQGLKHSTEGTITEAIIKHFRNIYVRSTKEFLFIENLDWNFIDSSLQHALCSKFEESEIKNAIFSFDGNKAPGPDGYTIYFYKKFWLILKKDIMDFIKDFHEKSITNKCVNNTFIALIAKKASCVNPKDYKPVSLTTSLYKILAKAIAIRLKATFPSTISPNQLASSKEDKSRMSSLWQMKLLIFSAEAKKRVIF